MLGNGHASSVRSIVWEAESIYWVFEIWFEFCCCYCFLQGYLGSCVSRMFFLNVLAPSSAFSLLFVLASHGGSQPFSQGQKFVACYLVSSILIIAVIVGFSVVLLRPHSYTGLVSLGLGIEALSGILPLMFCFVLFFLFHKFMCILGA